MRQAVPLRTLALVLVLAGAMNVVVSTTTTAMATPPSSPPSGCCRICPSLFYHLHPSPWIPKDLQPVSPSAPSFFQEVARATHRASMRNAGRKKKCCNVCPIRYEADAKYPDMLLYPGAIPTENGIKPSQLEGEVGEVERAREAQRRVMWEMASEEERKKMLKGETEQTDTSSPPTALLQVVGSRFKNEQQQRQKELPCCGICPIGCESTPSAATTPTPARGTITSKKDTNALLLEEQEQEHGFFDTLVSKGKNLVNKVKSKVTQHVGGLVAKGKAAFGGLVNKAKAHVGGLVNKAKAHVGGLIDKAKAHVSGLVDKIKGHIAAISPAAAKWLNLGLPLSDAQKEQLSRPPPIPYKLDPLPTAKFDDIANPSSEFDPPGAELNEPDKCLGHDGCCEICTEDYLQHMPWWNAKYHADKYGVPSKSATAPTMSDEGSQAEDIVAKNAAQGTAMNGGATEVHEEDPRHLDKPDALGNPALLNKLPYLQADGISKHDQYLAEHRPNGGSMQVFSSESTQPLVRDLNNQNK